MTNDKPSDTPRTDQAEFTHTWMRDGVITGEQQVVDADFARQLERELAGTQRIDAVIDAAFGIGGDRG